MLRLLHSGTALRPGAIYRRPLIQAISRSQMINLRTFRESTSTSEMSNYSHHGIAIPRVLNQEIYSPQSSNPIPCYQILDNDGAILEGAAAPEIEPEKLLRVYQTMAVLREMDNILYEAQRQGRISFYMTCTGEEGAIVGSAAALSNADPVMTQYREQGVFMWRGFTIDQFTDQCVSNDRDMTKGRQMPVHYGSALLNAHTVSSPLATQIPQAVGIAYGLKRENAETEDPAERRCAAVFFGEGAASEGDFHAAMNFAATLKAPCLFLCRNNGYAISTPANEQFMGEGIAVRARGYGMHYARVDGNDTLAVYDTVQASRKFAIENNQPVLIELMSYRVGHHSTSDDSTRYRSAEEIQHVRDTNDPIKRLREYLVAQGAWTEVEDEDLTANAKTKVLESMKNAEAQPKAPLRTLFTDVYDTPPAHLQRQREGLKKHMDKYGKQYESLLRLKRIKMDLSVE